MYERFYGLRERPFELTADPRFVFLSATHREALSSLVYGIRARKGVTVLVGEAGTGKTTLLRALLARLRRDAFVVHLSNPALTPDDFFATLARRFSLSAEATVSKGRFLLELQRVVLSRHAAGQATGLVIDEAQSLPLTLMEEVRLLSNLETATEKLLPLVLSGQPELADRLNTACLRQLKQRIAVRCLLRPLTLDETHAYIATRMQAAGGSALPIFTRDAVELIHERSCGIPRTISVICDNVLVSGFAARRRLVDSDLVLEVCRDFELHAPVADLDDGGPATHEIFSAPAV